MKNNLRIILALIAMFVMIGSYFVSSYPTKVEAASKKLKVTVPTKTVAVNTTITLKTNVKSKFKSSNKKIATVSAKGVVKAKTAGNVTITVTSKANKAQKKALKITVKNQLVITAPDGAKATLQVGETTKIKTNLSSKYVSSDANIAEVSSNGTVTAKSAGTATITVTSKKYKKLKKTVTITVTKPEEKTTTEATTDATTTQQPTSNDIVKPGDKTTTEAPTAQKPSSETTTTEKTTSEEPTSEEPTSEEPTSEEPTSEDPTPAEKTVVGIEAKYRGDKVPNNLYMIDEVGINLYKIYSDGSKELVPCSYSNELDYTYLGTEINDGTKYANFKIEALGYQTNMAVELVDTETLYPYQIVYNYTGDTLKSGETPDLDDVDCTLLLSDKKTYADVDKSKLIFYLYFDYGDKYEYWVAYDYTFTDENGNELYVCPSYPLKISHE